MNAQTQPPDTPSLMKTNNQKKRFFDKVQGINFPEDWNNLTEEEKSKRLEKRHLFL